MARRFAATCIVVLACVGAGHARPVHEEYGFVGTLVRVDLSKDRVVLRYEDNKIVDTVELDLTPKTAITRDKRKVPKSTLKQGLTVAVRAWGDADAERFEALSIRIVPPLSSAKTGDRR